MPSFAGARFANYVTRHTFAKSILPNATTNEIPAVALMLAMLQHNQLIGTVLYYTLRIPPRRLLLYRRIINATKKTLVNGQCGSRRRPVCTALQFPTLAATGHRATARWKRVIFCCSCARRRTTNPLHLSLHVSVACMYVESVRVPPSFDYFKDFGVMFTPSPHEIHARRRDTNELEHTVFIAQRVCLWACVHTNG